MWSNDVDVEGPLVGNLCGVICVYVGEAVCCVCVCECV